MKIVLLNTHVTGGASYACYRLYRGLLTAGLDALMLVRESSRHPDGTTPVGYGIDGRLRALLDYLPILRYPGRQQHNFSPAWIPGGGIAVAKSLHPDLIHLHWIVQGFVPIEALSRVTCQIVWTLHDSWPFTGGCHLPGDCRRYEQSCGKCPVLGSNSENDWSRRIWQRKNKSWKDLLLTVVAPSHWLADRARCSALFSGRRIEVIPNGINTALFCPGDKVSARRALGLPEDRKLVLFGANNALSDNNKGFDLLQRALATFHAKLRENAELVIFGEHIDTPLPDCVLPVTNLGEIHDEGRIVLIYRAADIFVVPSRQENLPNMIMEALACGTPCVAFAIGGIPELIDHGETGYLALPYETDDMACGVVRLLEDETMRADMSAKSRQWALNTVSMDRIVERYATLYRELTGQD